MKIILILCCFFVAAITGTQAQTIGQLEKNAKVVPIPAISRNNAEQSRKGLENWLKKQSFTK